MNGDRSLDIYFGMIKISPPSSLFPSPKKKSSFDTQKLLNSQILLIERAIEAVSSNLEFLIKKILILLYFNLVVKLRDYLCILMCLINEFISYFIFYNM